MNKKRFFILIVAIVFVFATAASSVLAVTTFNFTNGIINSSGYVGIGQTVPGAKLTIVGLGGTAMSTTFTASAGALGTVAGNELIAGSLGGTTSNTSALGIRLYREAGGADWTTTGMQLSYDVDNTPRAGAWIELSHSGNVGIGTNAPAYKLDVNGAANFGGYQIHNVGVSSVVTDVATVGYVNTVVSGGGGPWTLTGSNLYTSGAYNVGIGTTVPGAPLSVVGNALFGNNSAGTTGGVQITSGGASPISNRLTYGTDGTGWKFAIGKNQGGTVTDQLTIQDNGNVGIGTTSPAYKLDVAGAGNFTSGINALGQIGTNSGGEARTVVMDPSIGAAYNTTVGGIYTVPVAKIGMSWYGNYWYLNAFRSDSTPMGDFSLSYGTTDYIRVQSAGNVGIGTNAPAYKLDVNGAANFGGYQIHNVGVSSVVTDVATVGYVNTVVSGGGGPWTLTGSNLYTSGAYNVGIRTTDPASNSNLQLGNNNSTNRGGLAVFGSTFAESVGYHREGTYLYNNGTGGVAVYSEVAAPIMFGTSNAERVRIDSAGKVGIGTTTPRQSLDVWGGAVNVTGPDFNGTAYITSSGGKAYFGDNSSSTAIVVDSTGNLGIGTVSPGAKLAVSTGGTHDILIGASSATNYGMISLNGVNTDGGTIGITGGGGTDGNLYLNAASASSIMLRPNGTTASAATVSSAGISVVGSVTAASFTGAGTGLTGVTASSIPWTGVTGAPAFITNTNANYYVTAGNGNGICFWGDCTNYKIHMGSAAEYWYGPVNDYAIKFNMGAGGSGRGWVWGGSGVAPIAALSVGGSFQVAGTVFAGGTVYGTGGQYGVQGYSASSGSSGVYGFGVQNGVLGSSSNGYGVYGNSSYVGVYGSGAGVGSYGVFGAGGPVGVYGTGSSYGVQGYSTGGYGVYGYSSSNGYGVYGNSSNIGVYGNSSAGGYGGYFTASAAAGGLPLVATGGESHFAFSTYSDPISGSSAAIKASGGTYGVAASGASFGIYTNGCTGCSVLAEMVPVAETPTNGDIMCTNPGSGKAEICRTDKSEYIEGIAQKYAETIMRMGCNNTLDRENGTNGQGLGVMDVDAVLSKPECKGWYPIALSGLSEKTNVVCSSPKGKTLGYGDVLVSSGVPGFLRPLDRDEDVKPYQIAGKVKSICAQGNATDSVQVWVN